MTTLGSRYVQLLQGQPDPNNGTIYGGLASALQKGMMGYAMGQDRAEEEAKQGRLTQALQMMAGTPDNTITWNQPTRPDGTGDPTTTIPGQAPDRQGAIGLLLQDNPDLALQLMNSDYNFNRQQEAAAAQAGNELVTVVRNGVKVAIPRSQMQPGEQVDYTPTPEAPEIRPQMLPDDMVQDLQFNPLTGEYDIPVGDPYSRWETKDAPAANYVNFANRDGQIQSVDLSTDQGRATAQALTQQGYFEVGTNVNALTLVGLGGAPQAPTGPDGTPRDASPGFHWTPTVENPDPKNPNDWSMEADTGGPNDPATLSPTDRREYSQGIATIGRTQDAFNSYLDVLFGPPDADGNRTQYNAPAVGGVIPSPTVTSAYRNLLLELKEAYNLGVLNGPDLTLMESILTDPTAFSLQGALMDRGDYKTQLDLVEGKLREIGQRWDSLYPGLAGEQPQAPASTTNGSWGELQVVQ